MLDASNVVVSISIVCNVYRYAWVSVLFIMVWMWCGSSRVSAFEFATMYMFRLYVFFESLVLCVCGSVIIFLM